MASARPVTTVLGEHIREFAQPDLGASAEIASVRDPAIDEQIAPDVGRVAIDELPILPVLVQVESRTAGDVGEDAAKLPDWEDPNSSRDRRRPERQVLQDFATVFENETAVVASGFGVFEERTSWKRDSFVDGKGGSAYRGFAIGHRLSAIGSMLPERVTASLDRLSPADG